MCQCRRRNARAIVIDAGHAVEQMGEAGGAGLQRSNTFFVGTRSEEHTSELQSQSNLVCRLLLEKKKKTHTIRSEYNTCELQSHSNILACSVLRKIKPYRVRQLTDQTREPHLSSKRVHDHYYHTC